MTIQFITESLEETASAGEQIAREITFPACVYLNGGMGVGKTTLTKSILRGLGYTGAVTSPTYNLIQEYSVEQGTVYHMDLYRLTDPSELAYLAIEDLWSDQSLFLVEWPQKGVGFLPSANWEVSLNIFDESGVVKRNIILNNCS